MLTENEKNIIKQFKNTRIPSVYKLDDTDNILYIEDVKYFLCDILLKNKKISIECVQNKIKEYAEFLEQVDISIYDDDAKKHLILLTEVINIFLRNNLM